MINAARLKITHPPHISTHTHTHLSHLLLIQWDTSIRLMWKPTDCCSYSYYCPISMFPHNNPNSSLGVNPQTLTNTPPLRPCPSVRGWPIRSDLFDWLDAWMQSAVLLEGINVTISHKQPRKQLSNVQFHEDFGPGCVLSLSVSSSLPLLWRAVTTGHSIGPLSCVCVYMCVCVNTVMYTAVCDPEDTLSLRLNDIWYKYDLSSSENGGLV